MATLTNPASLTAYSLNTFTAPAGTTLAASTTYWITVGEGISSFRARVFYNSGNDQTGETGWSIGNGRLLRDGETSVWSNSSSSLLIAIKGTAIPTISLVSNTYLSRSSFRDNFQAQSFETGANVAGYTVSEVTLLFGIVSGKSTSVSIKEDNGGEPGNLVDTLANPGTLTSNQFNTFTAQPVITLAANTTYWLTVNEGISSDRAEVVNSAGNEQSGETGWSIGDGRLFRTDETMSWLTATSSLLMTIKGTVVPCDGIWCATLQVQDLGSDHRGCDNTSAGNECTDYLSDDDFTHGLTNYSVTTLYVQSDGQLHLWLQTTILPSSQSLVLHVGSDTFTFKDADGQGATNRVWNNSGLSWTTGDAIELKLKLTDAAKATGDPTIDGVPQVDMMLTADTSAIDDVDGLPATFTFQWVRVATGGTETDLGTNSTYTVSSSDVASTIRVDVSFTDLAGNSEGPLPSEATAQVLPAAGPCPAGNDWCATMTVGTYETLTLYGFSEDIYGQLDEPTIDYGRSFEIEEIYIFELGDPTNHRIYVGLDAYVPLGTVFNLGGTEFTADAGSRVGSGTHIWSRPANFAWIDGQEVRVSANLAPAPESATVDGTSLVLTHSEDLDTGSVPPASAYTVKVDGDAGTNPSTVSVGTRTVTLTLATAVTGEQVVTVSYDVPASNPLQDASGRNAPAFADFAVTNNTDALVSNTHLTPAGPTDKYEAQSFTTGGNTGGYTISAVHIRLDFVFASSNTSVKIRENNDSNQPGELVATLANPTSLTTESLNTFLAQDTITLDPRTTYWISVNEGISTSNTAVFGITAGNEETGEPGWSIGDSRLSRTDETHSWSPAGNSLLIAIKGTVPCDGIWCATLQVQDFRSSVRGCDNVSTGNECTDHLSDDDFTHAMTDYSVTKLYVQSDGQLQLWLQPVIATGSKSLVLHVGSETFAFKDANSQPATSRVWNNSGLSWTTGDAIGLKLTEAAIATGNATGNPTISGVPQVGRLLAADISAIEDVDGLPATFTYQWVRVATDSTATNLGTGSTHTVSSSDVASTIRVDVRFTDMAGNSEGPLPSEATAQVVPAAGLCPAGNDWCATMTVGTRESFGTVYGFSVGFYGQLDETTIDYGPSFEVEQISIYEPDGFDPERIFINLDAYVPPGTVFNLGGTKFTANAGRTADSGHYRWSRPANFAWIYGQEVTVSANLAPAPESATVEGTSLVLTHSEDLDTGSVPPASAYTVRVEGNGTTPSSVSVGTRTVTLTLATPVIDGQVVTVSYDVPASNPLQDVSGRNAPAFNNFAVTNNTEAVYRGPTFTEGTDTTRTFEETFGDAAVTTATNIGQPVAATDPDTGDTLTYTLDGTDAVKFDIVATSGQLLTKVGTKYDYEQNRTYSVTVVVEDSDDNSDEITVVLSVIDQNEPPLAPTPVFVSPTSGSASKLNVSWNRPTNTGRPSITNYDLQYREVDASNYSNGPQNVSGTSINISGLRPSTVYEVQVRATNAEGDGPWTPAVERSTSQNSEPDPPAVTYGLRATGVSQTRIDLSWNAPTDDGGASITGYRIEVSDDDRSTWSDLVANTSSSSRTYAHTGLTAGVTRHYRVSAINRVGTGLASAVASGQTQAAGAKPKRPGTMYIYFTVSDTDLNESEEATYTGNSIEGDCSREKYFRAYWIEKNNPPVDEWEVRAEHDDDVSDLRTQVRYSNGNREHPEFIGSARFAAGPDKTSSIHFAVRGRYGSTWGAWGPTSVLQCKHTE